MGELFGIADRISVNREFAGVHYASDTEVGQLIAQLAFPILRLVFEDVFLDAIEELNLSPTRRCDAETARPAGLPWNLEALGVADDQAQSTGAGVVVGMIDGAIDVSHPMLAHAIDFDLLGFENPDYPAPAGDPWCMGSKGVGHGTAMAGLIVGRDDALRTGVAPDAKLYPVRAANLAGDKNGNRFELAALVLATALDGDRSGVGADLRPFDDPFAALLLSLDFARPDPVSAGYLDMAAVARLRADRGLDDDEKKVRIEGLIAQLDHGEIVDPFALVILIAQRHAPIVIPSGNHGASLPAYPGAFQDVKPALAALDDDVVRPYVARQLGALMRHFFVLEDDRSLTRLLDDFVDAPENGARAMLATGRSALASAGDPFEGSGVVVVGAAAPIEANREDGAAALTSFAYSNRGPGLCVVAPSAGDGRQRLRCGDLGLGLPNAEEHAGERPVTTADIFGPGGFASAPEAAYSHEGQTRGFGGTSAAAAQVAGLLALSAAEASSRPTGAEARRRLVALARRSGDGAPGYSAATGYGMPRLERLS